MERTDYEQIMKSQNAIGLKNLKGRFTLESFCTKNHMVNFFNSRSSYVQLHFITKLCKFKQIRLCEERKFCIEMSCWTRAS